MTISKEDVMEKEEWKDDRPFRVFYDIKNERWAMEILDPTTREIKEKKMFVNGMWKKFEERKRNVATR